MKSDLYKPGRWLLPALGWLVLSHPLSASGLIQDGNRVVFLGDSNTYAGGFVTDVESQWIWQFPRARVEMLNLGLPSETVSGLSEPDHPFPRPNVHERAARVMRMLKPDVVVICYGMNDGIYYPFSKMRFAQYQDGIRQLIKLARDAEAKVVLMTPPPFDRQPLEKKGKLLPESAGRYNWMTVYQDYDQVMKQYAEWILSLKDEVDLVVDIRTPMVQHLQRQRQRNADYAMSGDGVHFNRTGHRLVADSLLRALEIQPQEVPEGFRQAVSERQTTLRDSCLSYVGHKRPGVKAGMPYDQALRKAQSLQQELVLRATGR